MLIGSVARVIERELGLVTPKHGADAIRRGDGYGGGHGRRHIADQAAVEPIYEEMDGWKESTEGSGQVTTAPL